LQIVDALRLRRLYTAAEFRPRRITRPPSSQNADITPKDKESDKASFMSGFKEPNFADRQKAATEARKNILAKFKSQPGPDDPAVKARAAEREAQAAVRAKAKEAREAGKAIQKAREAEEAAAAAAQAVREEEEAVLAKAALEAQQKAARDARYAARKKRK
jgi:hypothetical protein